MADLSTERCIDRLRHIIDSKIKPLITGSYYLADAPYYHNIGDVLIWQGVRDFCKTLPGKNLGTSNVATFLFPDLPSDATILLMGGGNFGDLWRIFQNFRLEVVRRYPHNRIIMFPQSVWYNDQSLISQDRKVFSAHHDLHLCARDQFSFDFMKEHFPECDILLVPDMAFYIDKSLLQRYQKKTKSGRKLDLKRLDKEFDETTSLHLSQNEYDVHDWPTFEKKDKLIWLSDRLQGVTYRTRNSKPLSSAAARLADTFAQTAIRHRLVRKGLRFLAPYSEILTTRLHTMILATLLGKKVEYIDNTTGKLSAFAGTWLPDLDSVTKHQH